MLEARLRQRAGQVGGDTRPSLERSAGRGRRAAAVAVAVSVAMVATGCTMCPDPFDYSGPVPNGSTPQNDFRARSNGILPLGAAPMPWPVIVHDDARPADDPTGSEPAPTLADEDPVADLRQTGAVAAEPEAETDMAAVPEAEDVRATLEMTQPVLDPVPEAAVSDTPVPENPAPVAVQAATPTDRLNPHRGPGETPGWRARVR